MKAIHGRLSEVKDDKFFRGGARGTLFANRGELSVNAYVVNFSAETEYANWADMETDNVSVVVKGCGVVLSEGREYLMREGYALKILPGQSPVVRPEGRLTFISVQIPALGIKSFNARSSKEISVVNPDTVREAVYEYEALAQEIFTPDYEPALGLLKFTFCLDCIPLHIHPFSDRLIVTISGEGYTFVEPDVYDMEEGTFTFFPKGVVHTNGPVPGNLYRLWAFQIPWIKSGIDEENVGGHPRFVKYVGSTPIEQLQKKRPDFLRVIERLEGLK